MSQPQVERSRPAKTRADIIERDDRKLRLDSRHCGFTPEYIAWLSRQRKKKDGTT